MISCSESSGGTRIAKTILQNEVTTEQARKLFSDGKTDVIEGFISRKTKRPFSAHLLLDSETGKLTFEFPPRPAKKKAASKKKKSKKKKATAKKRAAKKMDDGAESKQAASD